MNKCEIYNKFHNFDNNHKTDLNSKLIINSSSFISTKNHPDEFETFNFGCRKSFTQCHYENEKYISFIKNERDSNSISTNPPESNKMNIKNEKKEEAHLKYLALNFPSNKQQEYHKNDKNSNFPIEGKNHTSILNNCPEVNFTENLNHQCVPNLHLNREKFHTNDYLYLNNFSNTYDSNYGNNNFFLYKNHIKYIFYFR